MALTNEISADNLFSWETPDGETQVLNADVVMTGREGLRAKTVDHAVEDGSTVADHVVIDPLEVEVELIVSQTPIEEDENFRAGTVSWSAEYGQLLDAKYELDVRPSQFVPGGFLALSQGARAIIGAGVNAVGGLLGLSTGGGSPATAFSGSTYEIQSGGGKSTVLKTDQHIDRVSLVYDTLANVMKQKLLVSVAYKGRVRTNMVLTEVSLHDEAGKFGTGKISVGLKEFPTVSGVAVSLPSPADFRTAKKKKAGNKPSTDKTEQADKNMKSFIAKGADAGVEGVANFLTGALGG